MKHGFAFGDHIKTEKIKHRHYDEEPKPLRLRWYLLPVLLILVGVILLLNLLSVQIIQGNYYQHLSDSNRIRSLVIPAPRGVIFDRNGTPLVFNTPGFQLVEHCNPGDTQKCTTKHLNRGQALALLAKGSTSIHVDSLRQYPYSDQLSDVLGYIGQISQGELSSGQYAGYQSDAWVGQSGIEQEYEQALHGQDGQALIEVNAMGQKVRALGQSDPIPGNNITLTIDLKIQQAAYNAAKDLKKESLSSPNQMVKF